MGYKVPETYKMNGYCENCGYNGEIDIPKGEKTTDFQKKASCYRCGVVGEVRITKPLSEVEKLTKDLQKKYPDRWIPPSYPPHIIPHDPYWYEHKITCSVHTPDELKDCQTYNSLDK